MGTNPAVGKRGPPACAAEVAAAAGRTRATLVLTLPGGGVGVPLPGRRVRRRAILLAGTPVRKVRGRELVARLSVTADVVAAFQERVIAVLAAAARPSPA